MFEVEEKKKKPGIIKIILILLVAIVLIASIATILGSLLVETEEEKYGGHGFEYMHGYSSTDFKGYHVYDGEKLVTLDHEAEFQIEDEEEMPVMDGAEACYPVYAAVAKAIYKDIDKIELQWKKDVKGFNSGVDDDWTNGKIVSFTNTVEGYDRLIHGDVDLMFAARPSEAQRETATEYHEQILSTPIGREAFVFFVEEDNPVENLTSDQIRAIYHGDITNWQEVGGKDRTIVAFQRPEESGSQVAMKYFMGDISLKDPDTMERVDAMAGVIEEVKQYHNEAGAMGYTFRYFLEGLNQEQGVKMLSVDGIYPSVDNIKDGSYPITVSLVCARLAGNKKVNTEKVIDFLLTEDGQRIIQETGYGPLDKVEDGATGLSTAIVENEIYPGKIYTLEDNSKVGTLVLNYYPDLYEEAGGVFELTVDDFYVKGTYLNDEEGLGENQFYAFLNMSDSMLSRYGFFYFRFTMDGDRIIIDEIGGDEDGEYDEYYPSEIVLENLQEGAEFIFKSEEQF